MSRQTLQTRFVRTMGFALAGLLMTTLANGASPRINIPGKNSLAVISRGVDSDLKARFNRDSTRQGASSGANAGAQTGLVASAVCGPLYFLCAIATVPVGAAVGAATGASVGAVKDSKKKPSMDDLVKLNALLEDIAKQRTLHQEIADACEQRIPAGREAPAKEADALLEVSLGNIRFQRLPNGNYEWMLRVNLASRWNRNQGRTRGGAGWVEVFVLAQPLSHWIDQDGTAINVALDELVDQAAERIERQYFY